MSDSEDNADKKKTDHDPDLHPDDKTQTYQSDFSGGQLQAHHPKKIGRYVISRVIASGGMGTVFEALQENPKRPVAVKVIKGGLANESAVRRLEYEAQMLARLRHPGIAQIYEAGSFDDGSGPTPFFAMEYIPNAKPITEYASENKLNTAERITLFLQVCDAVHHGHQRGIVHRDLKPSNILVDSSGRVRIIDFGVARATDADMRQAAGLTNYGQIIGTVQYMSPEQFDADPHDIDIRSDVYALGLILYELLSGRLPYEISADKIFEFGSAVREGRTVPIGSRDSSFKGDLEAVIQMAMHRDRGNRYQSAYGLASDIRRFSNGDAVVATRPGLAYQAKIFARKNKIVIGLVAAAFVLLLSSVIVTSSLLVKVEKERQIAEIAKQKAVEGQQFLSNVLTSSFPRGFGDDYTVVDILDNASKKLAIAFPDDPEIESGLRLSIGEAYLNLGHYKQSRAELVSAYELHRTVYGNTHDKTLDAMEKLSLVNSIIGDKREELKIDRTWCNAIVQRFGDPHLESLLAKYSLAGNLEKNGLISEAKQYAEESWLGLREGTGVDSDTTLKAQIRYAWILAKSGSMDEATDLAHDAFDRAQRSYDKNHWIYKNTKSCLAGIYIAQANIDSARVLYGNREVPDDFGVEISFQGDLNLNNKPFQLLVFFETWCPYSKNAMTELGRVDNQYNKIGLDIFGFTKVSKNTSVDEVKPYLDNLDIDFAVFKENGASGKHFDVDGYPAIRLLCNGYLIWEKEWFTSDYISHQMLDGLVAAQSRGLVQ